MEPRLAAAPAAASEIDPPASQVRLAATRGTCARPHDGLSGARDYDATLVRAALAGDAWAAPEIVARYRPLVRRTLRASLSDRDVEDHVQEVFARCFQHLSRLREPASLRSFLIGISVRLAGSERRRRRVRRLEVLTATGELPEVGPREDDARDRHVAWKARQILAQLRPESSRMLELRFVEEKKLADVAATMGVSIATAKRHLARASARVRAIARRGETAEGLPVEEAAE